MEIEFILPAVSEEPLADMLRALTAAIDSIDSDKVAHGFLGRAHGYGATWDNDVFTMRPFYWGDCDCGADEREEAWSAENKHSADCYQSDLRAALLAAGGVATRWGWVEAPNGVGYDAWCVVQDAAYKATTRKHGKPMAGCAVHCTCGHQDAFVAADVHHRDTCAIVLPNFVHKRTGMTVEWYKYIGRGMEATNAPTDLTAIFNECVASLPANPNFGE